MYQYLSVHVNCISQKAQAVLVICFWTRANIELFGGDVGLNATNHFPSNILRKEFILKFFEYFWKVICIKCSSRGTLGLEDLMG